MQMFLQVSASRLPLHFTQILLTTFVSLSFPLPLHTLLMSPSTRSVGRFELGEWNHISACVLSVVKHWAVDGAMTAIEAAVLRGAGATSVSSALRVSLFISVRILCESG